MGYPFYIKTEWRIHFETSISYNSLRPALWWMYELYTGTGKQRTQKRTWDDR